MDIIYRPMYSEIDNTIYSFLKKYLEYDDIDKIYKQWNFWDANTECIANSKEIKIMYELRFIGVVLSAVAVVQPYGMIEWYLEEYHKGNYSALLSFVLRNVKWSVLGGLGKKLFEGNLSLEIEEYKRQEEKQKNKTEKKDKKQELLEKVQQEIKDEYPAFKEVFYKKYRDGIASMVFNLNGNVNDSELLERLIEDEMVEDFSNFKIKQIENLLKNS